MSEQTAMTRHEFLTAAVLDARTAYAAYESMRTEELLQLQIAHQVDHAQATTPEALAFGGGRLALIAAVLKKRESVDVMRVRGACSWCDGLNPVNGRIPTPYCQFCGHRADLPRSQCDCPKCWKPVDR